MATFSPVYSPRSRSEVTADRDDDAETSHFLTVGQLALLVCLGVAAWAAVLGPFLF
jgi:hypothetical protein